MGSWVWLRLPLDPFLSEDATAIGVEGNHHLALDAIVIDALDQPVNEPGLLGRRQRLPHRRKVPRRVPLPDLVHDQLLNGAGGGRGRWTALPGAVLWSGANV